LFGAPQSTVSECSETVGGLLCGQQQLPQNNTHYTPFVNNIWARFLLSSYLSFDIVENFLSCR
ncbi:hypothetical protein PZH37_17350, partial [[Eubacterium] siraeum]|nr:hypothetical protein [[Eubacterium] siraeum]